MKFVDSHKSILDKSQPAEIPRIVSLIILMNEILSLKLNVMTSYLLESPKSLFF